MSPLHTSSVGKEGELGVCGPTEELGLGFREEFRRKIPSAAVEVSNRRRFGSPAVPIWERRRRGRGTIC
jgi:hypothetical protein